MKRTRLNTDKQNADKDEGKQSTAAPNRYLADKMGSLSEKKT